ncbi:MAG: hypothetical protein NC203_10470 [Firmicutes bacterium]|nr:hypothetical protein [[Eubacterium] siraeum]MCM1488776.1 hypothetical protein [Bacillota bacterium]
MGFLEKLGMTKKKMPSNMSVNYEVAANIQVDSPSNDEAEQDKEVSIEELLAEVNNAQNQVDKHYAYAAVQDYYYKRRKDSPENVKACIDWCLRDISELYKLDVAFAWQREQEKKKLIAAVGKKHYNKWDKGNTYLEATKYDLHIEAFKMLAIIYEQEKDYEKAISIVKQAEEYYTTHNNKWLPDVQKRLERLNKKLEQIK